MLSASLLHSTARRCTASVPAALAHLSSVAGMRRWNLGLWNCRETEPGLYTGESLFDGARGWLRVQADPARGLVDYLVGPDPERLAPRIRASVQAGDTLGHGADSCVVSLQAWRTADMSDARWQRLAQTHETEIELICSQLESDAGHAAAAASGAARGAGPAPAAGAGAGTGAATAPGTGPSPAAPDDAAANQGAGAGSGAGTAPDPALRGGPARRHISSGSPWEELAGYSRAVVDGDWIFVSGTVGQNFATRTMQESAAAQTEQAMATIQQALAQAGAALTDVVRVRAFVPDREDVAAVSDVLKNRLGPARPTNTTVCCPLAVDGAKVEIEVTARRAIAASGSP